MSEARKSKLVWADAAHGCEPPGMHVVDDTSSSLSSQPMSRAAYVVLAGTRSCHKYYLRCAFSSLSRARFGGHEQVLKHGWGGYPILGSICDFQRKSPYVEGV